ncbi:MAG: hypothetical protein O6940_00305 [Ignavibacteria bacterium]|nr:hypothetical protein [Ignavibacteria bacterium]
MTATVRDMNGIDGCGFLLELENGEKLIPSRRWALHPLPQEELEDPLYNFTFHDDQKVSISYEPIFPGPYKIAPACVIGIPIIPAVITCIQEISINRRFINNFIERYHFFSACNYRANKYCGFHSFFLSY